ncbi:MAG: hypothetical protein LBI44_07155 [Oscillospiraceae bacterium]|jgi:YbbR domain-containing protein|nr:hypothetical protein [Oscillospiraceae bacterium]
MREKNGKKLSVGLLFAAIVTSLFLWAYVMVVNDPERESTLVITPQFIGEEGVFQSRELMIVSGRPEALQVRFTGVTTDLAKLKRDNVKIEVDLSEIREPGEHNLGFSVILPDEVAWRVTARPSSEFVPVVVDRIGAVSVEIRVSTNITVPSDEYLLKTKEFVPDTIIVTGPLSILNTIGYAEAEVLRSEPLTSTLTIEDLAFSLFDKRGEKLYSEYLAYDNKVTVRWPVVKTKTVQIDMEYIDGGGLIAGKNIITTFEPATIRVSGDAAELESFNKHILDRIDLARLLEPVELTYDLHLPNGMESVSGENSVKVTIEIIGVATRRYSVTNLLVTGFTPPPGYYLDIVTNELGVNLRGSPEVLDEIYPFDIYASADLTGIILAEGVSMEFAAEISLPGISNVGILNAGKYAIVVQLVPENGEGEDA